MRHVLPALCIPVILAALAVLSMPVMAFSSTVGIYSDENGASCSFSGNASGLLTAYVVVKPEGTGLRGVRFSAPIPACLGAVFVSEEAAPGLFTIGASETDISIAIPYCAQEPTFALQVTYNRTSTDPCCPFPVLQAPSGRIEGVDCAYGDVTLTGATAKFNADATCPCTDGHPPYPPHTPSPADWMTWVDATTSLSWSPSQYDGDIVAYDVYLGPSNPPALVATVSLPQYQPAQPLALSTLYFWRVVARDSQGLETSSPLWRFTTMIANSPPVTPYDQSPANNAINVLPPNVHLAWVSHDPNGDQVKYDVYFGDQSPPPLVVSNLTVMGLDRSGLLGATRYYWRVVARDSYGAEASGPEWSFTTAPTSNVPPNAPTAVVPLPGVSMVTVNTDLQWQCVDPNGDALAFVVYFGTTDPPPLFDSSTTAKVKNVGTMAFSTTHYWRIVARDPGGLETSGPVWSFTTEPNDPPAVRHDPLPLSGAINVPLSPNLTWSCCEDELPGVKFDIYFGAASPPPLVLSDRTINSYSTGPLLATTMYYWQIVAKDAQGLTSTGPIWTFTTAPHPLASNPTPADNGFASDPLTLSWSVGDPGFRPILSDLYFGTANPPSLVASDIASSNGATAFNFAPAVDLVPGTRYYWRVNAHTVSGSAMGPVWSFVGEERGDIDHDGQITTADAACALQVAINNPGCAGAGAGLADVNCTSGVTPRDALCIHRRAIGETCIFCGDALTAGEAALVPSVTREALWQVGSTLYAVLAVSNVPNFEAFSFWVRHPINAPLVSAVRRSPTGGFTALEIHTTSAYSVVGGYSLNAVNATSTTEFIELRFQLGGTLLGLINADTFVDDLAGAPAVTIASSTGGKGGGVPVIFSRFSATPDGDAVRIGWELHHDDALDSYTIYRTVDGASPTIAVVEAAVTATSGSYLDRSVEPGRTYRYEMMVRTSDGDEFRSQTVMVQVPGLELTLGANHPNPFNPQTTIPYVVPPGSAPVRVRLAIYDTSGRLVRVLVDENQTGGARDVVWRGDDSAGRTVTSGVYFCVLHAGEERRTQKLVLLK